MSTVLAIDPGNVESAWALIGSTSYTPLAFGKADNQYVRNFLTLQVTNHPPVDLVVIEMIAHYGTGMPAGQTVFDTVLAIGRFQQIVEDAGVEARLIPRTEVKVHHCHSARAKDGNVTQALVDRFAAGNSNHGKGTKSNPGWFHGFKADVWQAYALAVYIADTLQEKAA